MWVRWLLTVLIVIIIICCIIWRTIARRQARDFHLLHYVNLELQELDGKSSAVAAPVHLRRRPLPEAWEEGMHPDGR